MKRLIALAFLISSAAHADQASFRAIYQELIETNTAQSVGSCTLAAERMAARLKAGGYKDDELTLFSVPEFPKDGGIVAVLKGSDPRAKAILLLAHLDVVEAKREDWQRDPFTLVEENGMFYARGSSDDKAQAANWVDAMIRLKQEAKPPKTTVKMALTCGEEGGRWNGAKWLTEHKRDLIDAAFALNEGGFITTDEQGKPQSLVVEAGEKEYQDIQLMVTNPGGHASRPVKDNAIYHLAHALTKVESYAFPIQLVDSNRAYFAGMAKQIAKQGDKEIAAAMNGLAATPPDLSKVELVTSKDPTWNSTLRTTCVATMVDAGHAHNALPQRATANINCRIFPGVDHEEVRKALEKAIDDPKVSVTLSGEFGNGAPAPALTKQVLEPVQKVAAEMWPGLPVIPFLQPYATDGRFMTAAGIPTYGIDGFAVDKGLNNMHGLNEHMGVESLYKDRDFLYRLIKLYAGAE